MTITKNRIARSLLIGASAAALTFGVAACGGSDDGGGGSATCDQSTMEELGKEAAGSAYASFQSYECKDGFALVSVGTDENGVEGTEVFLFQAEGSNWALNQRDAVCADGGGEGVPSDFRDTLCALR